MDQKIVNLNIRPLAMGGETGNAFYLMGAFMKQARKENWTKEEIDEVINKCKSGDYDNLVNVLDDVCVPMYRRK